MTAGRGVLEALRAPVDPAGARVLVVGAGAAARAVALELALAQAAEIVVCSRSPERAAGLVDAVAALGSAATGTLPWGPSIEVPDRVGIVVVAVPTTGPRPTAPIAALRPDLVVADLAVVSQPSPVVATARQQGACVIDGLEIHCERTAIDFHSLTGIEPDTNELREALDEFLSA
jgi:shikimate dehydrogenase